MRSAEDVLSNFRRYNEPEPEVLLKRVLAGEVVQSFDAEYRLKPQIEYALQIEAESGNPMSRQLDGPHYAEDWKALMAEVYKAKAWYRRRGRKVTSVRYKRPGDNTVQEQML